MLFSPLLLHLLLGSSNASPIFKVRPTEALTSTDRIDSAFRLLSIHRRDSFYTVRPGDNARSIANSQGLALSSLAALNPEISWNKLQAGQRLLVSAVDGSLPSNDTDSETPIQAEQSTIYIVTLGDTTDTIVEKIGATLEALKYANPRVDFDNLQVGQVLQLTIIPPSGPVVFIVNGVAQYVVWTTEPGMFSTTSSFATATTSTISVSAPTSTTESFSTSYTNSSTSPPLDPTSSTAVGSDTSVLTTASSSSSSTPLETSTDASSTIQSSSSELSSINSTGVSATSSTTPETTTASSSSTSSITSTSSLMSVTSSLTITSIASTSDSQSLSATLSTGSSTTTTMSSNNSTGYVVVAGDTGYGIAEKLGTTFAALSAANPGVDWTNLSIGQVLNIPSSNPGATSPAVVTAGTATVTGTVATSIVNDNDGIAVSTSALSTLDKYTTYTGTGAFPSWPDQNAWLSFSNLWAANLQYIGKNCNFANGGPVAPNSDAETAAILAAIQAVALVSKLDHRFILAVIMQESNGCVRAPTTTSPPPDNIRNPGLMQSYMGSASCNQNGLVQNPCPDTTIYQMIVDGVQGPLGVGLVQAMNQAQRTLQGTGTTTSQTAVSTTTAIDATLGSANAAQIFYTAARIYNSGSVPANGDLSGPGATRCYASDIANRLTGWVAAPHTCSF